MPTTLDLYSEQDPARRDALGRALQSPSPPIVCDELGTTVALSPTDPGARRFLELELELGARAAWGLDVESGIIDRGVDMRILVTIWKLRLAERRARQLALFR